MANRRQCPWCNAPLRPLFTSLECPRGCDRRPRARVYLSVTRGYNIYRVGVLKRPANAERGISATTALHHVPRNLDVYEATVVRGRLHPISSGGHRNVEIVARYGETDIELNISRRVR